MVRGEGSGKEIAIRNLHVVAAVLRHQVEHLGEHERVRLLSSLQRRKGVEELTGSPPLGRFIVPKGDVD